MLKAVWPPLFMAVLSGIMGVMVPTIWVNLWLIVPFLIAMVIFIIDTYGRIDDYNNLKYRPESYFTEKLVRYYGKTWCGRSVMTAVKPYTAAYYRAMGYKWYHFFPDNTFTKKSPFFRVKFWMNLSGGHR